MRRIFISLAALLAVACGKAEEESLAHEEHVEAQSAAPDFGPAVTVGAITISEAWAPATPVGGRVAAGYLTIKNAGKDDDELLSVSSARAKSVEVHEMADQDGMMTMRAVPHLEVKAGESVAFAPGQKHLMFIDPALPYADGEMLPVSFEFEKAGKVEAQLSVRKRLLDDEGSSEGEKKGGH